MIACCMFGGTSAHCIFWFACVSLSVGRLRGMMIVVCVCVGGEVAAA